MKTIYKINILLILALLFFTATAYATIKVVPSSTAPGSIVTVTMKGVHPGGAGVTMSFLVDFGDGSAPVVSPVYTVAGTYTFKTTHAYKKTGTFTIIGATKYNPPGPPSFTENRKVTISLNELPQGTVGEEYNHSLASTFGTSSNRYRRISSRLPPGLTLQANGLISGVPTQEGTFTFTVQVRSAQSGITSNQTFTINIDRANLVIRAIPAMIDTTRDGGTRQKITFSVESPIIQMQETLRSIRGEFVASGRVLGYVNSPMLINLNSSQPSESETISLPNNSLHAARSAGASTITYRRIFASQNIGSGTGEVIINIRTAAAGQLRINEMSVFFEQNNRSTIVVDRNSKDLTGIINIHYNGSGTLKGYWQVDERIIQRVQQNLFYGEVLTLKTPSSLPLPTYSEGSHRLQFIVTDPVSQALDFPMAIYHVQAKNLPPINLLSPENGVEIGITGETFSWTEPTLAASYQLEFFEPGKDEPIFTAHVKKGSYTLPAKVLELKLTADREYTWHVLGFSETGTLNSESKDRKFILSP